MSYVYIWLPLTIFVVIICSSVIKVRIYLYIGFIMYWMLVANATILLKHFMPKFNQWMHRYLVKDNSTKIKCYRRKSFQFLYINRTLVLLPMGYFVYFIFVPFAFVAVILLIVSVKVTGFAGVSVGVKLFQVNSSEQLMFWETIITFKIF